MHDSCAPRQVLFRPCKRSRVLSLLGRPEGLPKDNELGRLLRDDESNLIGNRGWPARVPDFGKLSLVVEHRGWLSAIGSGRSPNRFSNPFGFWKVGTKSRAEVLRHFQPVALASHFEEGSPSPNALAQLSGKQFLGLFCFPFPSSEGHALIFQKSFYRRIFVRFDRVLPVRLK